MKIIANGGVTSKNVANSTIDALYLGLNITYVDGFKFKLYLTKDKKVIALSDDFVNLITNRNRKTNDFTFKEYQAFNVGNKVHKQQVITLKQILNILMDKKKTLILELINQDNDNAFFTDEVLQIIKSFANNLTIFLESKSLEIVEYLKTANNIYLIGTRVTKNSIDNFYIDVNFYDIDNDILNNLNIIEKINNNKLIMINEGIKKISLDYLNKINNSKDIYIITNNAVNLNNSLKYL